MPDRRLFPHYAVEVGPSKEQMINQNQILFFCTKRLPIVSINFSGSGPAQGGRCPQKFFRPRWR